MDPSAHPDRLSSTLAAWRVTAPRHPHFRTAVWARITAAERSMTWGAYVRRHGTAVASALVLAIAAGALFGRGWAQAQVAADSAKLAAAYVGGLDARALPTR